MTALVCMALLTACKSGGGSDSPQTSTPIPPETETPIPPSPKHQSLKYQDLLPPILPKPGKTGFILDRQAVI